MKRRPKPKITETYTIVLEFIIDYKIEHCGNSPTLREIANHAGLKSTAHTAYVLNKLSSLGKIEYRNNTARNIYVPGMKIVYASPEVSP